MKGNNPKVVNMKQQNEKINMLTVYNYSKVNIDDHAGADILLVDNSASKAIWGNATTLTKQYIKSS